MSPSFSISGSEFVEMFVGMGASKVRDLFKQAKEKLPASFLLMKSMLSVKNAITGLAVTMNANRH